MWAEAKEASDPQGLPASDAGEQPKKLAVAKSAQSDISLLGRRVAPPDVDEAVPVVETSVSCPLPQVLQAASQRITEFMANLERFTASERIEHEEFDLAGKPRGLQLRTLNYLVTIREIRPGMLSVDESRNGSGSLDVFPAYLATTGLPALALMFHPYYVEDFQTSCEGLGQAGGQSAWQIRFEQRSDRPSRIRNYRVEDRLFPVRLKGRVWIAPGTYQIVRLETDLVAPIREIRLEREHLAVEYRPVDFPRGNVQLWLPESAELYLYYRGHRYHRRHTFSDFRVFSVGVTVQFHDSGR